jgi:hypothetical protein
MASEWRVAPPAVGTVALACGHCRSHTTLALVGPGQRLWWRQQGRSILVEGFIRVVLWCHACRGATVLGDDEARYPAEARDTLLSVWGEATMQERRAFLAAIGATLR